MEKLESHRMADQRQIAFVSTCLHRVVVSVARPLPPPCGLSRSWPGGDRRRLCCAGVGWQGGRSGGTAPRDTGKLVFTLAAQNDGSGGRPALATPQQPGDAATLSINVRPPLPARLDG